MRGKLLIAFVAIFVTGVLLGRVLSPRTSNAERTEHVADVVSDANTKCIPHGIAADVCSRCNPDLIAHYKEIGDWCASHNVAESQCDLCGSGAVPEEAKRCDEHGIDASQCSRCNPELIAHFKEIGDWCASHNVAESQCELCNHGAIHTTDAPAADDHADHEQDPSKRSTATPYPGIAVTYASAEPNCPSDGAVIQFASIETSQRAGVIVQPVLTAPVSHSFEAPAEVVFDQSATTYMSSTLPLTIRRWLVEPGQRVEQGTALATVESPDVAALQGEFLEAWSDWGVHKRERERATTLMARGLIDSATHDRTVADAIASEGRAVQKESQLLLAGLAPVDLDVLRDHRLVSSSFLLRAPVAGTVMDRPAALGAVMAPGEQLVTIGDPDALWIEASVRERDLGRVRLGRHVVFYPDAGNSEPIAGAVTWISQFLDPHTRTGIVRMQPLHESQRIRAHEFGRLQLTDDVTSSSIVIPKSAVQWDGCCNVVFVKDTPDRFHPRKVVVERADNTRYRVVSGLEPEDEIVVNGSFLLKTELKKSSIGAGCCGLDAS